MIFNLKRAVSLRLFAAAILAVPFFTSCDNDDEYTHPREVIIMNENGNVITGDTIEVKLGSTNRTKFKMWFETWEITPEQFLSDTVAEEDSLYFWRQYDNNIPEDLSEKRNPNEKHRLIVHPDLESMGGWISSANVAWREYEMRTAFSKNFVHVGSIVKIWACVGDYAKGEVYYKVVE